MKQENIYLREAMSATPDEISLSENSLPMRFLVFFLIWDWKCYHNWLFSSFYRAVCFVWKNEKKDHFPLGLRVKELLNRVLEQILNGHSPLIHHISLRLFVTFNSGKVFFFILLKIMKRIFRHWEGKTTEYKQKKAM